MDEHAKQVESAVLPANPIKPEELTLPRLAAILTVPQWWKVAGASGAVLIAVVGLSSWITTAVKDREVLDIVAQRNLALEQKTNELAMKDRELRGLQERLSAPLPAGGSFPRELNWQWAGENWCGSLSSTSGPNDVRLLVRNCNKSVVRDKWPVLLEGNGVVTSSEKGFKLVVGVRDHRNGSTGHRLDRIEADLRPVRAFWDKDLRYFYSDRPNDPEKGDIVLVEAQPR